MRDPVDILLEEGSDCNVKGIAGGRSHGQK
uniref:Uncharacterized protein n=1 Tax=Lepeophtheirus salmonis TaxID=72036 RepID=A0A0K2URE7_LEPSM